MAIRALGRAGNRVPRRLRRPRRDRQRKPRKPRQPRQRDPAGEARRGGADSVASSGRKNRRRRNRHLPWRSPWSRRPTRPSRKRRRRRWGRRRKDVRVQDLLLPASGGRTLVYGESREACTSLLREVAADLSGASNGPDPIALLVDPSPDELAEWKRDAPAVEIVSAGQARHAGDAIAQATRRAEAGEDVIVLIDSLSRFAEAFKAANEAKELFDAGQDVGGSGSLTVVAAVERSE